MQLDLQEIKKEIPDFIKDNFMPQDMTYQIDKQWANNLIDTLDPKNVKTQQPLPDIETLIKSIQEETGKSNIKIEVTKDSKDGSKINLSVQGLVKSLHDKV